MKRDLLIEIGSEEIPAGYLPPALDALAAAVAKRLAEERIDHGEVERFATPRRLALRVAAVDMMQPDREREVTGPPKRIAFDEEGNPTKAAIGFAKTNGVAVEDLRVVETGKGEYLGVTVTGRGKPTAELLGELLPEIVRSLPFPKTMRWERTGYLFARPLQWIVVLLGEEVVPVEIAGVKSGRESRGHRILHPEPVLIPDPSVYEDVLRKAGVIALPEERRLRIEKEIASVLEGTGGKVLEDSGLLAEVNFLVELPHALRGSFDKRILALPDKVVITAMRSHQRYFSVVDGDGKLLPSFVTVANGIAENEEGIRKGNERVLAARLADAEFYWNEDSSVPPGDRVKLLGRMVWQEGMGSLLEKTERLEAIASKLAEAAAPEAKEAAVRAARLSKTDLTTEMIRDGKEFTALQGYMGMEYALVAGEKDEVAKAIFEQYLPRYSGDELPSTLPGMILSLADRVDTLLGCLGAGLMPTGSQDPYALRRQSIGILRILAAEKLRLPLGRLLEFAVEAYGERLEKPEETVELSLRFFRGRLKSLLTDKGLPYDVVDAVLAGGLDFPADLERRALAIRDFRESESFERLVFGLKRVVNILKGVDEEGTVDPALFAEEEEKALHETSERIDDGYGKALAAHDYRGAMELLLTLRDPIDRFFDKVLVMEKDEKIRRNRIALLRGVAHRFYQLADLSKVVLEGEKP